MQITIDYWLWAHLWKWKNSTCECQSTGIAKAQVQCIHTCTTWIRLHHREHAMPFFSQSPAEELCSGMHYFSCVGFSSSVASILLAIVRKYAPQKAHLSLLSLGFGRGGGWCWAHYCNLSWSWQMMVMWHYTTGRVGRGKHGGSRALTVGRSLARSSQSAIHSSFRQVVWIHHKACYHGGGFFS